MSTHSAAASSAVGRSFCGERKIIINLWFLTLNTFYTFTREWVGGAGGGWRSLTRRNFASMKNGFAPRRSKPQSLQQTRNAKFIHSARVVVVENERMYVFRVGTQPNVFHYFPLRHIWGISLPKIFYCLLLWSELAKFIFSHFTPPKHE